MCMGVPAAPFVQHDSPSRCLWSSKAAEESLRTLFEHCIGLGDSAEDLVAAMDHKNPKGTGVVVWVGGCGWECGGGRVRDVFAASGGGCALPLLGGEASVVGLQRCRAGCGTGQRTRAARGAAIMPARPGPPLHLDDTPGCPVGPCLAQSAWTPPSW